MTACVCGLTGHLERFKIRVSNNINPNLFLSVTTVDSGAFRGPFLYSFHRVFTLTASRPSCVLQVGNLGLLFMLLFFIYAALGVELFGELGKCSDSCLHVEDPAAGSRRGQSWCERTKQNTAEERAAPSNEIPLLGYGTPRSQLASTLQQVRPSGFIC